jgi:thiol-disulfide isomerase/thioredoxin
MRSASLAILALLPAALAFGQAPAGRPAPKALPPETDMSHDGWYAEFPPALAEAKRTGMDMLVDFGGSDWCAPCKWLKEHVLEKPAFNEEAHKHFVLVDIDSLARGLSPARKQRYVELQKRFRVASFPSVFLMTPEGLPYAWTTYVPATDSGSLDAITAAAKLDSPERFWAQIEPLIARGKVFREGMARAGRLAGMEKADALIDALSQIRADFLLWYYPDEVAELRTLDPADHRGFLAYLDGCKAYADLEGRIGGEYKLNPDVKVADVDALMAKYHLKGETLQQALAMKATLQVVDGQPQAALDSIAAFVAAQDTRCAYDRGDYMQVTPATLAILKKRVAEGTAKPGNLLAEYFALHKIFEDQELPNRYKISCHPSEGVQGAFEPIIAVRMPIGEAYCKALIDATSSLQGEERAKALGKGLEDTFFLNGGSLQTIVMKLIPDLVGRDNAASYVPKPYSAWLAPRRRNPAPKAEQTTPKAGQPAAS